MKTRKINVTVAKFIAFIFAGVLLCSGITYQAHAATNDYGMDETEITEEINEETEYIDEDEINRRFLCVIVLFYLLKKNASRLISEHRH